MYKSMNKHFGIVAALLLMAALPALGPGPGLGQDDESSKLGRRLSTAFDEGVIAYGHINLKKLDLGKVEKKLNQWLDLPVSISLKSLQPTKKVIEDAGGERIFVSYSLYGMDSLPTIAIPLEKEIDTSIIVSVVKSLAEFEVRYLQDSKLLVLAPHTFFKSIESGRIRVRRDVADLIRTKSAEVASINFAPTADHRRVLREFEPQFSDPFSRFDGELLGRSVKAASIVLESIEPFELKVGIRSEDQKSAANLKEAFSQLMKKLPGDSPELNFFRKLEQSFTLSKNTPGLSLSIGPEQEDDWKKAIMPFFVKAKLEVQQSDEVNNLKHMLLGLHNFHDVYRGFPDIGRPKDNGSPGLSWRVHILPFIEEAELYEQFRLDEPWDSPHNKKLIAKIPNVFQVANADVGLSLKRAACGFGQSTGFRRGMALHTDNRTSAEHFRRPQNGAHIVRI